MARLENYTFLTPNVLTRGFNVYAPLEEQRLRGFSNGHPKYPLAHAPISRAPTGAQSCYDELVKEWSFAVIVGKQRIRLH